MVCLGQGEIGFCYWQVSILIVGFCLFDEKVDQVCCQN